LDATFASSRASSLAASSDTISRWGTSPICSASNKTSNERPLWSARILASESSSLPPCPTSNIFTTVPSSSCPSPSQFTRTRWLSLGMRRGGGGAREDVVVVVVVVVSRHGAGRAADGDSSFLTTRVGSFFTSTAAVGADAVVARTSSHSCNQVS
jgi:hypothetical protein